VVVTVGETLVDPLADVDVNVPGVMAMLFAPVVAQLSVLLEPEVTAVGLAVKELIVGLPAVFTLTINVDVVEPAALVAVSVYVVVAVGFMLVEPLADVEVNVPGVMAILVASVAAQLSVLLVPEFMLVGSAVNEVIAGGVPVPEGVLEELVDPQPVSPAQANRIRAKEQKPAPEMSGLAEPRLFLQNQFAESMRPQANSVYFSGSRRSSSP
jgi:hypothetical protein